MPDTSGRIFCMGCGATRSQSEPPCTCRLRDASGRVSSLRTICDAATSWAGEYGFVVPDEATAVYRAVYDLMPEVLDPKVRAHFDKERHA